MSRKELETKTVAELRALCKEKGLQVSNHAGKFKKAELIESLVSIAKAEELPVTAGEKKPQEKLSEVHEAKPKSQYIETADVGSLIAFKVPGNEDKVDSAKIVNRSSKRAALKVINKQGVEYVVPYENVLWVRTGVRWPKGVYELLTRGRRHGVEVE